MPQLLAIAEYITKTLAICVVCGDPANHTQRLVASSDRVLVGATGLYEARCRHCFDPHLARSTSSQRSRSHQPSAVSIATRGSSLTGTLLLLGVGFLIANARLASSYVRFLRRRRGALLTGRARSRRSTGSRSGIGVALGLLVVRQGRVPPPAGVRRGDDVPVLRAISLPLSLTHRPRLLRGRHLGRHGVHPVQRGRRHQLARGRARGDAHRHLTIAQSCTPSHRAGRQVRRRAAPAARQDRRARDPFHRHRPRSRRARRTGRG